MEPGDFGLVMDFDDLGDAKVRWDRYPLQWKWLIQRSVEKGEVTKQGFVRYSDYLSHGVFSVFRARMIVCEDGGRSSLE